MRLVKIKPEWRDLLTDNTVYVVVESNEDRLVIQALVDMPIQPTELVRDYMIEDI